MSRLFISHSSANSGEAVAIRDWLRASGWHDVFLDLDPKRGIAAGERWERALNEAARRCEAVIFLVSRAWLASDWCERELILAHKLNKRLFGVLIEELAVSDIPPRITSTWQLVQLASGRDHVPFDVTLPITGEEKHVTFSAEGLARLKAGLTQAGLDPCFFAWPPESEPDRPPYRGLKPLEAEDAGIFFGREAEIIETLDRLRGLNGSPPPRLLVILGASGAGKSSFMRAGLWPRLKRDDRNFLPLPVIRPERAALSGDTGLVRSLEEAFKAAGAPRTRADIRKAVEGGADALAPLLAELAAKATPPALGAEPPKAPTLVFAIDQGEELFLSEGADEAQAFLALLRGILSQDAPACLAFITIRSDAYERLQTAAALETVPQHTLSLPPLAKGAYLDVIEGPVRRLAETPRGLKIKPALSAALLADIEAGGAKDALPLLAFTLERLYVDYGADRNLTLADYEALGRVKGSIEAAVERALKASDANPAVPRDRNAKLALLRRGLIPWLAGIDPDTGSPRRRVARLSEIPAEARPLVDHLVEARLLSTDTNQAGEITIEPSHEALLRQWGLLKGWLEEDFGALTTLEGVRRAASEWDGNSHAAAWLAHRSGRLEDAERQAARQPFANFLTAQERVYLAACRAEEVSRLEKEEARLAEIARAQARTRRFQKRAGWALLGVTLLLAMGLVGTVWQTRRTAAREAIVLLNPAQKALDDGLYQRAARIALLGLPKAGSFPYLTPWSDELEAKLAGSQLLGHNFIARLRHNGPVRAGVFSPDSSRILTTSEDKTARLWDGATGAEIAVLQHDEMVLDANFSPDGQRAVTRSGNAVYLWDGLRGNQISVLRHEGAVAGAAFSSNGARVLTWSKDKTVHLWDGMNGAQRVVIRHGGEIRSAVFSPDGRQVLTTCYDEAARLWDSETGSEIGGLLHESVNVWNAIFSPDGKRVVTLANNRSAYLWDVETRTKIAELKHKDRMQSAIFSANGQRLITRFDTDARKVKLWDGVTGGEIAELHPNTEVYDAKFSPDGTVVVTGAADDTARAWASATGKELAVFPHGESVYRAAFTPDGRRLLTEPFGNTVLIWDSARRAEISALRHEGSVFGAHFSPDGTRVLTLVNDHTAVLWKGVKGAEIAFFPRECDFEIACLLSSAEFSPDGALVLTRANNAARLWDAKSGAAIAVMRHGNDFVNDAAFNSDGTRILTWTSLGVARLWDTKGLEIAVLRHQKPALYKPLFNIDGTRVLTRSDETFARLWDSKTGVEIAKLNHDGRVNQVIFSPDGTRVLTSSDDKTARIWDGRQGTEIAVLHHDDRVKNASFSFDGTRVATISYDNSVRLWDGIHGTEIGIIRHSGEVKAVVFSPDGSRALTVSNDKTARLLDAIRGNEIATLPHADAVSGALFSPDGARIVTKSNDNATRLWDGKLGILIAVQQYKDTVLGMIFSPDGKQLVTYSNAFSETARLWDGVRGIKIATLKHDSRVGDAAFTRDGRFILTTSDDKTARIWDGTKGTLIAVLRHEGHVSSGRFSPDGTRMVTVSENGRLWDLQLLMEARNYTLRDHVCAAGLKGANVITASDASDPILRGLEGMDVCAPSVLSLRYWRNRAREAADFLTATSRKARNAAEPVAASSH